MSLEILPKELLLNEINNYLSDLDRHLLLQVCVYFNKIFSPGQGPITELHEIALGLIDANDDFDYLITHFVKFDQIIREHPILLEKFMYDIGFYKLHSFNYYISDILSSDKFEMKLQDLFNIYLQYKFLLIINSTSLTEMIQEIDIFCKKNWSRDFNDTFISKINDQRYDQTRVVIGILHLLLESSFGFEAIKYSRTGLPIFVNIREFYNYCCKHLDRIIVDKLFLDITINDKSRF